ncbi:uncharacterized protein LOC122533842 isoform X2 [Frieseomelitta varia]|uniref:uncharacterized protein LOC122533842 isoform X2 n=1 Tax=Frieseomelitta varia TaxID=561572 RepID=UPI001CB69B48|nr:uncharacterized protein LOC122533842 isoform X2 [Frieseomelitta varia]
MMDWQTVEDQCFKDNKFFSQLVGIWPDQERVTKFVRRLVILVLVIIAIITEVSRIILFYSVDALLDQILYLDIGIGILIKQYNYILNEEKLKELLNNIVTDHLVKRSKEEQEILDTYSKRAMLFSFIYKVSICSSALMFILIPAVPPILNVIAPRNESRGREFIYPAYYFMDEQKYYYPILAHMISIALILAAVYTACDTNLIYIIQHGCALFTISGYRFKHAMDDVNLCDEKYNDVSMYKTYVKVRESIEAHKKAVEYVEKVNACHLYYFLIVLGFTIVAFTTTFVRLSETEIGIRFFTLWGFTVAQLVHLFFLTIMGQFMVNSNEEIFQTIYEAKWYNGSSKMQSLFVLVLRKCLNPPAITGGGLVPLNLDTFVQVGLPLSS